MDLRDWLRRGLGKGSSLGLVGRLERNCMQPGIFQSTESLLGRRVGERKGNTHQSRATVEPDSLVATRNTLAADLMPVVLDIHIDSSTSDDWRRDWSFPRAAENRCSVRGKEITVAMNFVVSADFGYLLVPPVVGPRNGGEVTRHIGIGEAKVVESGRKGEEGSQEGIGIGELEDNLGTMSRPATHGTDDGDGVKRVGMAVSLFGFRDLGYVSFVVSDDARPNQAAKCWAERTCPVEGFRGKDWHYPDDYDDADFCIR